MSERRSRSGGTRIGYMFRRWKRSERKRPAPTSRARISVGRGDHAHVDAQELVGADALDFAFLERAQELRLHRERELTDLVEEERAAVGDLELPGAIAARAGVGAAQMTEELALDDRFGQRRAVHVDERRLRAPRLLMDRARHELLSDAPSRP
jgi:hypothetical protein